MVGRRHRASRLASGVVAAVLSLLTTACVNAQAEGRFVNKVHVYPRGVECNIVLETSGADAVQFDVGGCLEQTVPVADGKAEYRINTAALRSNDYHVRARLLRGGKVVGTARFPLAVAKPHDPERMPVWKWGGGGQSQDLLRQCGFTGGWLSSLQNPSGSRSSEERFDGYSQLLDEAARNDFDLGLYLHPLISKDMANRESALGSLPDGTKAERPYPLAPEALEHSRQLAETAMNAFGPFPALRHTMLCSEYHTPMAVHPEMARLAKEEAGVDLSTLKFTSGYRNRGKVEITPAGKFKDGVIPDDHPEYRFLKWWWERGHGTSSANLEMAKIVKRHRPDVITWHEPYRLAPVRKSHTGLDMIGTWTYGWPDIKRLCFTTYLQAAARPEGQKVQQDITLFVYAHTAIPLKESTAEFDHDFAGKDPFFTAGPDYAREATWIVFSQRPDCMAFYSAGRLNFANTELDPTISSPETFHAIGEISRFLVQPYGPAVLDCERYKPDVAVLASAVAAWFPAKSVAGYGCEQTLPYATLLMQNHVPFDVVLDDDVIEGNLKNYKTLVMPVAGTLTRKMVDQIKSFVADGGRVIANAPLRVKEFEATVTDFNFAHQRRVNGRNYGKHVTAAEDRRIMAEYADKLAEHVKGLVGPASSASPTVLANSLNGGDVSYHFFINDERTYGPRFGKYELRQELGVPQTARASVAVGERPALYDAFMRKLVKYEVKDGRAEFDVTLPAARGKLIAALPEPVASVRIEAPEAARLGERVLLKMTVLGESGRVFSAALPLHMEIVDPMGRATEWSRYTTTRREKQGACEFAFTPAVNNEAGNWTVRVTDLIAGQSAETAIACAAAE